MQSYMPAAIQTPLAHPERVRQAIGGARSLLHVLPSEMTTLPLSAESRWFSDAVGQFVASGIYLLAGQPGSRKSGLALQLGLDLARRGHRSLLVLTEEPASRLKERALKMTTDWPHAARERGLRHLNVEQGVQDVADLPDFVRRHVLHPAGPYYGTKLLVLDSIQGHGLPAGAVGKYRRLYAATRLCQAAGITTLLVSHVTKRNQICGPRDLEHNVDVVLLLQRALGCRPMFIAKNRFGPAMSKPFPLELDPQTTRLRPSPHARPATSVARSYMGGGTGPVEVQAAVSLPALGGRGRLTCPGLPRREVEQLAACLAQLPGIELDGMDFTVHCRLFGERAYRPAMGLPLCMALLGSYLQRAVPPENLYVGEVDLCRAVRDLPPPLLDDLAQALQAGELPAGGKLICPSTATAQLSWSCGVAMRGCRTLDDAVRMTWPDLNLNNT